MASPPSQVLLAYGANLGAQTHDGFSPKDKAHEGQRSGRATGPQNKYAEVIDLLTRCESMSCGWPCTGAERLGLRLLTLAVLT